MMPVSHTTAAPSHHTQVKVEKELKKADKEYAKAEKGYQKGSIRSAEKHENRGMAHELKADGLTVGSHHGHNEATRVAMLHGPTLVSAQPAVITVAGGPQIISGAPTTFYPENGITTTTTHYEQGFVPQQTTFVSGQPTTMVGQPSVVQVPHAPLYTQPNTQQHF